jgi:Predicted dehydrogenases and related proteins
MPLCHYVHEGRKARIHRETYGGQLWRLCTHQPHITGNRNSLFRSLLQTLSSLFPKSTPDGRGRRNRQCHQHTDTFRPASPRFGLQQYQPSLACTTWYCRRRLFLWSGSSPAGFATRYVRLHSRSPRIQEQPWRVISGRRYDKCLLQIWFRSAGIRIMVFRCPWIGQGRPYRNHRRQGNDLFLCFHLRSHRPAYWKRPRGVSSRKSPSCTTSAHKSRSRTLAGKSCLYLRRHQCDTHQLGNGPYTWQTL